MFIGIKFRRLSQFWQVFLLLIPIVNWMIEISVRGKYYGRRTLSTDETMFWIAFFPTGILLGFIDAFLILFRRHIVLEF